MREPINIDYNFTKKEAEDLIGISLLPDDIRREAIRKLFGSRGKEGIIRLFSAFIGMANSVVANNREFIEEYLFVKCDHQPQEAAKINLATIHGALKGVTIAANIDGMCKGCAYRLGTPANQSPITAFDADFCLDGSSGDFMCHMNLDEQGEQKTECAGYAALKRKDEEVCENGD